jgi:hypothetical protein
MQFVTEMPPDLLTVVRVGTAGGCLQTTKVQMQAWRGVGWEREASSSSIRQIIPSISFAAGVPIFPHRLSVFGVTILALTSTSVTQWHRPKDLAASPSVRRNVNSNSHG